MKYVELSKLSLHDDVPTDMMHTVVWEDMFETLRKNTWNMTECIQLMDKYLEYYGH